MSMYDGGDDLRVNLIIMSVFFMINFKKLIKEIDKMIIDGLIMMNNQRKENVSVVSISVIEKIDINKTICNFIIPLNLKESIQKL